MKRILGVASTAFSRWNSDKAPKMAAALAFYSSFALAPILFFAIWIAGLVFGQEAARGEVVSQIQGLIGADSAKAVEDVLRKVNEPKSNVLASLLGLLALMFGASGVFAELQDSLNVVWKVAKREGRGLWGTVKDRFLSFSMVLGLGFLLLVSLVVSTGLAALGNWVGGENAGWLLKALSFVFSFAVVSALFSLIFRFLPDARTPWTETFVGGAVTAFLFTLGKFAIGTYLGTGSVSTTYGAAAAFLLVLLWVYYSSQILFLGAEFTKALADLRGHTPPPDGDARRVAASATGKARKRGARTTEIVIEL